MNREQVLERLEPLTHFTLRDIEHGPRTKVLVQGEEMGLRPGGGKIVPVAPGSTQSFMRFCGVPGSLATRLSDELLGRVAGELLAKMGRYQLVLQDNQIIDATRMLRRGAIPPQRVIDTVERQIPEVTYRQAMFPKANVAVLDVVGPRTEPVVEGDLVRGGAMITFSPLAITNPTVQSFVERLVCTNGATTNTFLGEFGFGEGDSLWHWFRQAVAQAYNSVGQIVERWRAMLQEEIASADRALVLEGLLKQARLSKEAAEAVRAQALEQPPANTYEAMNLITFGATHFETEPVRVLRARDTAAKYADVVEHHTICPTCRRVR